MKRTISALALLGILTACGSSGTNPFDDDTDTDPGTATPTDGAIPESLANDLQSFTYNPGDNTITVTGISLDDTPSSATFTRNAALDTRGYEAYTTQDDGLTRHVIALVRQSGNSGSVRAGVVSTGGQFNRIYNGGYYERDGAYSPPSVNETTGIVRYVGTYAGITNIQINGGSDLLPTGPGTNDEYLPNQAFTTSGHILINVDFSENSLEGAITERVINENGAQLESVVLTTGEIADDGTFFGDTVEYDGDLDTSIGVYGGIFGGPDAEAMGGVVSLSEFDNSDHTMTDATGAPLLDGNGDQIILDSELEVGTFVLDACGTAAQNSDYCTPPDPIVNP